MRTGAAVNQQAAAAFVPNSAALADVRENDFAAAISTSWQINGDTQPAVDLPLGTHKFTGMSAGTAQTHSINLGQVQDGSVTYAEASGRGEVLWPLRVAVSGLQASPGHFEIIEVLGKADAITRIETAFSKLA